MLEAIDTLPEIDRQLMKSFYLEGASYETLQQRYGLSKGAVAMRLFKAKRKVREKVLKMLSSVVAFPWRDVLKKLFLGGIEAVKISATTKLVVVWTATLLIVGGITVSVWYDKSSIQEMSKPVASQVRANAPIRVSVSKPPSEEKVERNNRSKKYSVIDLQFAFGSERSYLKYLEPIGGEIIFDGRIQLTIPRPERIYLLAYISPPSGEAWEASLTCNPSSFLRLLRFTRTLKNFPPLL